MAQGAKFNTFFCLVVVLFSAVQSSSNFDFSYFDDYLSSLDDDQQAQLTGEPQESDGSGSGPDAFFDASSHVLPLRTGLLKNKDVTCCSLGHLAGDKGYHCVAKFYAARVVLRNQNRAHNRKLGFYGRSRVSHYGTKLMRTFEQCVATRGGVFHKCCDHAARLNRQRPHFDSWQKRRYDMKMKRIRFRRSIQVDNSLVGV